ncbi:MAG: biopolymer transporter ExbD [Candidatus Omnitrophica bacterium]|nr:biopolymer transporter ExbD [Candidatus Omnitrophota bacterium]MDD5654605.1 biopolymer transporter ExbD [Candidatus Omnitrophota bacterium]
MNLKPRKQRLVSEINITPFTDVILVLLVIFMITTPLISQSSIKVKLPQANSGKPLEGAKHLMAYITITTEGSVYLDEKITTKQELKDKMSTMYRNNPDLAVILRSDRLVRFKDIVEVLDILSDLGITRLDIAATKEK